MKSHFFNIVNRLVILMMSCVLLHADEANRPGDLHASYQFIGEYETYAETRLERGQVISSLVATLIFRVYSDGVDVRVYCVGLDDENFTAYQIYQSNGIGVSHSPGEIDYIAGVQASCTQGEMLRQISLTRESLVMVKMPTRSERVIVTNAKATQNVFSQSNSAP